MATISNKEITIAVLPFQILTDHEKLSPIILGFTEDLIVNFSKFVGLQVISQYSSQNIKDPSDTETIEALGLDYLVTGSFRITGEGLRIGVQLIRTEDNKVVFAGQHDEELESILQTQDAIIHQIVSVLQLQIDYDLLSYSYKKKTVNIAAYENYLLGMNCLINGSLEDDLKARDYFEAALGVDPHYALAYAGISLSYFNDWSCRLWDIWEISKNGAQEFALKALELDENDYVALMVLGRTYLFTGDFEKAEHYFRKSLRMNPNDADNLASIAFNMIYLGYNDEAEKLYQRANHLNPFHKDNYFAIGSVIYFVLGDFEKSLALGLKVPIKNYWADFYAYLAATNFHLGKLAEADRDWQFYVKGFEKNIFKGEGPLKESAIKWQNMINPFKGYTPLQPYWSYLMGEKADNIKITKSAASANEEASIIESGEMWQLIFRGSKVSVKDTKGIRDIIVLLNEPEKEFHCHELMGSAVPDESGMSTLDKKAKADYQKRMEELQSELSEAEQMNDTVRESALREEYELLIDHLSQSLGLAGKPREVGSSVEKARSAITWRIRSAIKKIEKVHPQLGNHLAKSIKTGTFSSYRPELKIDWAF